MPSLTTVWPPNHELVDVSLSGITDADGDPIDVKVVSIHQDEPLDTYGDGTTEPDAAGIGTATARIRAERAGTKKVPGDGRVYRIGFQAVDPGAGTCLGEVLVGVPHDMGGVAVDSRVRYDSTSGASVPVVDEPTAEVPTSLSISVDNTTATTAEDSPVELTFTARNLDPATAAFHVLGAGPAHGFIGGISAPECVAWGDGTRCTATATYLPARDYHGADSFRFVATDGLHGWEGRADIGVEVVNDPPNLRSMPSPLVLDEDSGRHVLTVDAEDVETAGGHLVLTVLDAPAHGWLRYGDRVLGVDDTVTGSPFGLSYEPAAEFSGQDSLRVRVTDAGSEGLPATSAELVVPLRVTAVDDAPVAAAVAATTAEDHAVLLTLTAEDRDSAELTFASTTPVAGSLGTMSAPLCRPDGAGAVCTATVRYTPSANSSGDANLGFTVFDGTTTVPLAATVTVTPVNDEPVVSASPVRLDVAEDSGAHPVRISATDVETPASQVILIVENAPAHGALHGGGRTLSAGDELVGMPSDLTYESARDFAGDDGFTVVVRDGGDAGESAASVTVVVPIEVTPVNDAPVVAPVAVAGREDTAASAELAVTDVDDADLIARVASAQVLGTVTGLVTNCRPAGEGASCTVRLDYKPDADANGPDDIVVAISDGSATTNATVSIRLLPVNDAPRASADGLTAEEATALVVDATQLLRNDTAGPANEALQSLRVAAVAPSTNTRGSVELSEDRVSYTGPVGFIGTDEFVYTVCDDGLTGPDAAPLCDNATVTVTVEPRNNPPVVTIAAAATAEDEPVTVTVTADDVDGTKVTFGVAAPPAHGTLGTLSTASCAVVDGAMRCTTTVSYEPGADYRGADSFVITAADGKATVSGTAAVTVSPVNDAPTLGVAASVTVAEDSSAVVPVSAADVETAAADLLVELVAVPEHGEVRKDGVALKAGDRFAGGPATLTYTPTADYYGADGFTLRVSDTGDAPSPVTSVDTPVAMVVTAVNDAPETGAILRGVRHGDVLRIPVADLASVAKPGPANEASQRLTVASATATDASHGTVALANGVITYTSDGEHTGDASFAYSLCDDGRTGDTADPQCAPGTVTVTVTTVGPAPTIGGLSLTEGMRVTAPVPVNATLATTDGSTITSWSVVATRDGAAPVTVASGTGTPPATLGTFDPTVLANDLYTVTISAETSAGGIQSVDTTVIVDGKLKLGRISMSFRDLDAALGSTSLPLMRNYDSIDKRSGDFGFGWTLAVDGFRLRANRAPGVGGWERYIVSCQFEVLCTEAYRNSTPHFVAVTFPDGHVETFDFTPKARQHSWWADASFTARRGTTSKLEPVGTTELFDGQDGTLYDGEDILPFNPTRYRLTTRSGQVLTLDVDKGLVSLREPGGVTYTISETGISSSVGGGGATYTRDGKGRITQIDAQGTTRYSYDAAGDLATVTDAVGDATTFTYDDDHRLLKVNGPGGAVLRRMEYDEQGRVVAITDAAGNTTAVASDVGARTETVTDPTGRLTTISALDELGNVVRKTEAADGTSRVSNYTYDADGRVLSATDPLGRTTRSTYNAFGELLTSTDAAGQATTLTYGSNGQLLTRTDASGAVTTHAYDAALRMTSTKDAIGGVESYAYGSAGRMTTLTDPAGGVTRYGYDAGGHLTSSTDPLGRTTRYSYHATGQVDRVTDPAGAVSTSAFDAAGKLLSKTDPLGAATRYAYDELGRTTSVIDPTGETTAFTYAAARVATKTDPLGNVQRYSYDAAGRLLTDTDATGAKTTYTYDGFGQVLTATDPLGAVTRYAHDAAGQLTSQTAANGATTTYAYDVLGRRTTLTDALGGITRTTFNALGHPLTIADPLGRRSTFGYDAIGRQTSTTDPAGAVTRTEYDAAGRMAATVDPAGARTAMAYDAAGQLASTTDPTGRKTRYGYDATARQVTVTDVGDRTSTTRFDAAGRVVATVLASGAETTFGYDALGNRTSVTDPLGHTTRQSYDAVGRLVADTNALGQSMRYTLDGSGRITKLTDELGGTVQIGYDAAGRQTSITDPNGVTTTVEYNAVGARTAQTDALGRSLRWSYDPLGRLASAVNARGQKTQYHYDAAGQLTGWTAPEGEVSQQFDAAGRRTALVDPTGTTSFGYNPAGTLTSVTSPRGSVGYSHDAAGRRTSLSVAGRTVGYGYDAAGRLAMVDDAGAVTSYGWDVDGNVTALDRPNGIRSTFGYDGAGRLQLLQHQRGDATVARFDYTVDAAGNRTAVDGPDGREAYVLDAGGRLTKASYGDGSTTTYGYDPAGNRTSVTTGGATSQYAYDAAGQLASVNGVPVSLDADGNVTAVNGEQFAYDSANRLVSATAAGQATSWAYDGDGHRATETPSGGASTGYLYDTTGEVPLLLAADGQQFTRDPYGQLLASTDGSTTSTPLVDGLGTVRALTDSTGAVVGRTDFDAYGVARASTGVTSPVGYTGGAADPGGLVDLNARQYAPGLGQFLQADTVRPAGPGTLGYNTRTYALNNPTTYTDPSGHSALLGMQLTMQQQATLAGIAVAGGSAMWLLRNNDFLNSAMAVATLVREQASVRARMRPNESPAPKPSPTPDPTPNPRTTDIFPPFFPDTDEDDDDHLFKSGPHQPWTYTPRPGNDVDGWPFNGLSTYTTPARLIQVLPSTKDIQVLNRDILEASPGIMLVMDPHDSTHWFVAARSYERHKDWAASRPGLLTTPPTHSPLDLTTYVSGSREFGFKVRS